VDNGIVTVPRAYLHGEFKTRIDSALFLPKKTGDADRDRGRDAPIPDDVVYRSKSEIAPEQYRRAVANGLRFDGLTLDEGYGRQPGDPARTSRPGPPPRLPRGLHRRGTLSRVDLTAAILPYHQARNLAAKKSRLKRCHDNT
jgi:hypothetical protein